MKWKIYCFVLEATYMEGFIIQKIGRTEKYLRDSNEISFYDKEERSIYLEEMALQDLIHVEDECVKRGVFKSKVWKFKESHCCLLCYIDGYRIPHVERKPFFLSFFSLLFRFI